MVSAEAGTGKHFSLSAFSMVISGSIESFSLRNSQNKDFAQKIPCISHEPMNSMLSLSLLLILGDGRRPWDMWYSKWLNAFRWKKLPFSFFCIMKLMWAPFSCALLSSQGQEHQISFRRKCLRWAVGHWNSSPGGVQKWDWTPFFPGMEVVSLPPALGWLGEVLFVPC